MNTTRLSLALLAPLAGLFFSTGCANTDKTARTPPVLAVVSIDGFRPEFYLTDRFEAPELKSLARSGTHAKGAIPSYPSLTFPGHATLVTGVAPAKHGVLSNTIFNPKDGSKLLWYWDAKALRVPAVWDWAKASGKTVGIFGWPVSLNANADWLIPEVFSPHRIDHDENWKLTLKHTRPEFMAELNARIGKPKITSHEEYDQWMVNAALATLERHRPSLLLLHLRSLDIVQHETGRDSAATYAAVKRVDDWIGQITRSLDLERSTLLIVGDHGFTDVSQTIELNTLFAKKGWLRSRNGKITDWKVIAHSSGGQAAVYARDPNLEKAALALLRENAPGKYTVLDRERLAELGSFPEALCAVDPLDGYEMGDAAEGPLLHPSAKRGQHGALPNDPRLWTGFIAAGAKVTRSQNFDTVRLVDIAPTMGRLLGLEPPVTDGTALPLSQD